MAGTGSDRSNRTTRRSQEPSEGFAGASQRGRNTRMDRPPCAPTQHPWMTTVSFDDALQVPPRIFASKKPVASARVFRKRTPEGDITPFNPGPVDRLPRTHAAGLAHRPTAAQLEDCMNAEAPIPGNHHEAIRDTITNMSGLDPMTFRQNNGSSIRGLAHLLHDTRAFIDRAAHCVDHSSDIGDRRNRWYAGFAGSALESPRRRERDIHGERPARSMPRTNTICVSCSRPTHALTICPGPSRAARECSGVTAHAAKRNAGRRDTGNHVRHNRRHATGHSRWGSPVSASCSYWTTLQW